MRELTENYTTHLETKQQPKSKQMASLMMGGNAWKGVIAAACEGTVSLLQDTFLEYGGDRSWPWLRTASQASLCLPLPTCWSFLPPCACPSIQEHGGSPLDSLQPSLCLQTELPALQVRSLNLTQRSLPVESQTHMAFLSCRSLSAL